MGIDLNGCGGYERFTFTGWGDVQLLALLHGWEPQGTYIEYEDSPVWQGYYYNANSGQTVRKDDAWNIAVALTRALDNLVATPEEANDVDLDSLGWPRVMDDPRPPDERMRRAFATWAEDFGRERIEEPILFCAAGAFRIS